MFSAKKVAGGLFSTLLVGVVIASMAVPCGAADAQSAPPALMSPTVIQPLSSHAPSSTEVARVAAIAVPNGVDQRLVAYYTSFILLASTTKTGGRTSVAMTALGPNDTGVALLE